MRNCCTERGPGGSLWYEMYWLKKWSYQNLRCILLIQSGNKRRKKFYNIISNIQGVLNLWRMRNLTLEGRIVLFKTLAISKIIFLALLTKIPHQVFKELEKIQKSFLWKDSTQKIRHETTCKDYKDSGLKNVDISYTFVSLQCSWIRRLYDNKFSWVEINTTAFNNDVIWIKI